MITAVDTNILLDILGPDENFLTASSNGLEISASEGSLVVCDIVYAELCCHFSTQRECDSFLENVGLRVQSLTREAHLLASRAWRLYRKQGGTRDRILADCMIGAHATTQATRLLTRDRGFYRKLFPRLTLLDPTAKSPKAH